MVRSNRRCLISFSGGETSAFMTWWLLQEKLYEEYLVVFANTGQENEETLKFVHQCDQRLGFKTVWIEAVQFHGERRRSGFRVVTFETADRSGRVFEDAIRKYGIPNQKFKDCTRNLKRNPIESYAESVGWEKGSYDLAIGIRVDEIDRQSTRAKERRIVYPLIKMRPMTKPQINTWWARQPFRLQLKGYQGNCKWCWKKSMRKHLTIMEENAAFFKFPERMEKKYGLEGPEFRKDTSAHPLPLGYRRTFFRGNRSVADIRAELKRRKGTNWERASDDAVVYDEELDLGSGCEESCEVYADEDEKELI